MKEAIEEARKTMNLNYGGPFGAMITKDNKIIAIASNTVLKDNDPTAHAEINAIRKAGEVLNTHDLSGCILYATGYPCPMCLSAIIWSNIKEVYYGTNLKEAADIGFRDEFIYDDIKEKNKVTELIYEFANKIEAAVIEFSYNTYILISTKTILETETENYTNIELLKSIEDNSLNRISMGIGYGKTASEAKYKANEAIIKAKRCKNENVAYIIYEDGKAIGPIKSKNKERSEVKIDDRLMKIAQITNVSVKKILCFYNAINTCKKDRFTAEELSKQCDMSYRTVNRTINKLEKYGYIEVVGKHFEDGSGRPRRIIKFNI